MECSTLILAFTWFLIVCKHICHYATRSGGSNNATTIVHIYLASGSFKVMQMCTLPAEITKMG